MLCEICHDLLSEHTTCDTISMGLMLSNGFYDEFSHVKIKELENIISYSFVNKALIKRSPLPKVLLLI